MIGTVAVVLGIAGAADAHEPSAVIDVRWSGPAVCGPEGFEEDLAGLLAESEMSAPLQVEVSVASTATGWVLQADFSSGGDSRGRRVFEASACETVRDAAALAIALTVDPSVFSRSETPPQPAETPPPAETDVAGPQLVDAPVPSEPGPVPRQSSPPLQDAGPAGERSAPPWHAGLGALGFVDGLALPGVGGGLSLLAAAMRGPLRLELQGSYRFATVRSAELDPSVGGRFAQWTAGLGALWIPRWSRLEVPVGGGVDAGQTIAEGRGFDGARRTLQPWIAAVGVAGVSWVVRPRLALLARASLAVPLLRHDFSIQGLEHLHRVGPVQARGLLGLEVRLP